MAGTDEIKGVDMKEMYAALEAVASKWISHKLTVAALKLIGCIGAIDQTHQIPSQSSLGEERVPYNHVRCFAANVCKTLLSVLSDDSLVSHHFSAARALMKIFCHDQTSDSSAFYEFIPLLLNQIRKQRLSESLILLTQVCADAPKEWVRHFSADLIELVRELWKTNLLIHVLDLIPTLAMILVDEFSAFLPDCTTFLLDCLYTYRNTSADISRRILVALTSLKNISGDLRFLICPELVDTLLSQATLTELRIDGLVCGFSFKLSRSQVMRRLCFDASCSIVNRPTADFKTRPFTCCTR
jgi:hypothetical protein